jgi:DNA-binding transcriptional LysR family regulator
MLDLQKLETFRVVALRHNFTRAAEELGYSQSSVTGHIKALERELGAPLFLRYRFSRTVVLTEVGRRTLEYAGRLLALAPMAANVAPWLSPFAAFGLATIMLLAVLYHLRRHEPPVVPAGLFLLALFVMIGRFSHWA